MSALSKFPFGILRLVVFLVLVTLLPSAHALDPAVGLAGYRHDRWSELEGAPSLIDAIAQTDDGWLWIASRRSGLYRFDGVRFIAYETRDGSRLQNTGISVLQPGPDDTLWIGHGRGGVSVLRQHRFEHILAPEKTGSVFAIAHGRDGSAWVASRGGLFRIRKGQPERMGAAQGYDSQRAEYVMVDSQGRTWASDGVYLFELLPGAIRFQRVRQVDIDPMLIESADGSVWLVVKKRFERLTPPAEQRPAPRPRGGNSYQSAFDSDGNLWTGNCPVGLCVLRPDAWRDRPAFDAQSASEHLDQHWQLSSNSVLSVFTDRENNVWVGTAAGLDRLRDQDVHMLGEVFDRGIVHALPHPDGGMVVLENQRLSGRLALWRIKDRKLVPIPNPLDAHMIARAPDGGLVLAGARGIERQDRKGVQRIPLPPIPAPPGKEIKFRGLAAGNDELWAIIVGHGVWRYRAGTWGRPAGIYSGRNILAIDAAGRTYIGSRDNRLKLADGEQMREILPAPGVDLGGIEYIYAGTEVVVSGSRGYGIVRNGRLEALHISTQEGLGPISGIARDGDGAYWLNSSRGVLRVSAAAWASSMRDPSIPLEGELFDALDGYLGGAETIWLTDTASFAQDGTLWLAGERGLAWLNPHALKRNRISAGAEVLELSAGDRRFFPGAAIELDKGSRDVQIDYAAPSLRMPQRVRFRYRLIGADRKWEEAGTRRTAFYKNLPPGDYTFEVLAFNEHGLPGRQAGTLHFRIAPGMTETWWFFALCVVAVVGMLALLYRVRVRRLAARMEERFDIRVSERESIARALHDTFLQSLQGLLLSMQAVVAKLPPDSGARREFDSLLERGRRVLVEGRDEVKGLRNEFGSGAEFWQVLLRDVGLMFPDGAERIRLTEPGAVDRLHMRLHHDVYAITREAIVNALRHTQGPVEVDVFAGPRNFVLSVKDSGEGLGPFKHGKPGHFGLQGMRERAAQIGARLDIAEREPQGTRVSLAIPAQLAYFASDKAVAGV